MKQLLACVVAALAAGCASQLPGETASGPAKPRLVVFMVVDGFPQRQVVDYYDQLAPDGLRRFLDRGAWFADAHYGHAFTVTAAGHATMLTGAYPHRTGIIGNEWYDPVSGELEYCTADSRYTYIGNTTKKLDGTSPKNLNVETVGDVLKRSNPASKVIAMSGKDRGAILPGGKTGVAYMYMSQSGQFASTTFYMTEHPQWVNDFNGEKRADRYFQMQWKPLLAESAYSKSLPDNQKFYTKGGALPKTLGEGKEKPDAPFYASLLPSPYADAMTLDFARAAIKGEKLGTDDGAPDILSVSLSGHDYVNHAYSAESRLSHDHVLQLDQLFQSFFRDLDAMVGKDNYVLVLTADHGFMPAPEYLETKGAPGGKMSGSQTVAKFNKALAEKYGEGKWVKYISARSFVIDRKLAAEKKADVGAMIEEVRRLALAEPGIMAAYTRPEFESMSKKGQPWFDQMEKSWNRERSGDVEFAFKPGWMTTTSNAATHGSAHPYDTNIPILFYGPTWVRPGRRDGRVEEVDVAPTLARILGVSAPPASEGKPLPIN